MLGCGDAARRDHAGGAPIGDLEALDFLGLERGAEATRVGQAGPGYRLRVHGTVLGREQGAEAFGRGPGPALPHFAAVQPVAAQPGLALARDVLLEPVRGLVVEGDGGDPGAPETDIDPRGLLERWRERLVQVAPADRQADQDVVQGLDLGRQHPGRRRGRRRGVRPRLEDRDLEPAQGGGAGAGGADRAPADDRDVDGGHALAPP